MVFTARRRLFGAACTLILLFTASAALAANPSAIDVTVTIQNISVSTTGPIPFGIVAAGSATISSGYSLVQNDGNVTETMSLNLSSPAAWTSVQTVPAAEEYCLSAMFNSDQPASEDFVYADHALYEISTFCTLTRFAGDQTGVSVPAGGARYLWLKFEAPSSTTVTTEQTVVVTVTVVAG